MKRIIITRDFNIIGLVGLFVIHAMVAVTDATSATLTSDNSNREGLVLQLWKNNGPQNIMRTKHRGSSSFLGTRRGGFNSDDPTAFRTQQWQLHKYGLAIGYDASYEEESILNVLENIPRGGGGERPPKGRRSQRQPKSKGSSSSSKSMSKKTKLQKKDHTHVVLEKVRNIIRSLLAVGERRIPILAQMTRMILGGIESLTGISLLAHDGDDDDDGNDALGKKLQSSKKKSKKQPSKTQKEEQQQHISSSQSSPKQKQKQKQKQSTAAGGHVQSHLQKELKTSNPNYRIQRELKEFLKAPPPNLSVKVGKNIRVWVITMVGTKGSLYEGETYRLRVQFPSNYPTEPPSVYFLQPTPRHEHVYTNGDICLSLLGKDWRPNMTAQSIAMSILSILSGASRKSLPMDNAAHAQNKPGERQDNWVYHDDNC